MGTSAIRSSTPEAAGAESSDDSDWEPARWLVVLLAAWFLAYQPWAELYVLLCGCSLIWWLIKRRWIVAGLFFLLLPTNFAAGSAARDYYHGTGRFQLTPGYAAYDPIYRITASGEVCGPSSQPMTKAYNLSLKVLIRAFGWQRGTYDGPHPTLNEAHTALAAGVEVPVMPLREYDQARIGSEVVKLDEYVGAALVQQREQFHSSVSASSAKLLTMPIRASIWNQRCVIVAVPVEVDDRTGQTFESIALIDRDNGRPYAFYQPGDRRYLAPPIPWQKP